MGVSLQLSTIQNKEGDPRRKALGGYKFKSKEWGKTVGQHWESHLAQWESGTPIDKWWEEWKVSLYKFTSDLEHQTHRKQHQERESLHIYMHLASQNAIDNPTSKGATSMLNKAHKRVHDWENQQAQAKRRQRVAYGVNVAEHLHPSF